jgi:hypothetical protein
VSGIELLLYWIAPIIAVVYVLGYSAICEPIRSWPRLPGFFSALLDCPMCIGFWAGCGVGAVNWAPVAWPPIVQSVAVGGCLAVAVQYLIEVFGRE